MGLSHPTELPVWRKLEKQAYKINRPENHLKHLIASPERFSNFSLNTEGFLYDFSRQRVDKPTMSLLLELAEQRALLQQFNVMHTGALVNRTEKRAALHTASRNLQTVMSSKQNRKEKREYIH